MGRYVRFSRGSGTARRPVDRSADDTVSVSRIGSAARRREGTLDHFLRRRRRAWKLLRFASVGAARFGCARAKASGRQPSMMRGPVCRIERAVNRRRATRGRTLPWANMNNGELVAETLENKNSSVKLAGYTEQTFCAQPTAP